MKIMITMIILLLIGCSSPTETTVIEIFTVIEEVEISDKYDISPLGGLIPVTAKWRYGLPVLRGTIRNVSEDTLFNKRMRFTITDVDNPDNVASNTIGYMTLDQTEFKYFTKYPYTIELDLVPKVVYHIYVIGDTLDLINVYKWWFRLEDNE